ncbi:MAG: hypothetical protein K0S15_2227 [Solirubrobacterales bacterium]|nr:hypothetical protein [Solirubrobacterales bacterium]
MATQREERLALNEAMFREANERAKAWEERHRLDGDVELYLCECADPECRERVSLSKADYERVRSDSCHFAIVPGHEVPDVETVIERNEGWTIIEKAPEVSDIVEARDPRRD